MNMNYLYCLNKYYYAISLLNGKHVSQSPESIYRELVNKREHPRYLEITPKRLTECLACYENFIPNKLPLLTLSCHKANSFIYFKLHDLKNHLRLL